MVTHSEPADLPKAALPRGMRDLTDTAIARRRAIIDTVESIYRLHGFAPLETPALERADALGAHLPDDTQGGGVLTLRDSDGEALALRYDMTAPLARYAAEHRKTLAFPFRRYAIGPVWRDEKPGPGRYREFWQCDADTVGAPVGAADAEMCGMLAAVLEALGLARHQYEIRLNDRRVLDGVMEEAGLGSESTTRLTVFRAIDKLDRLGTEGVTALLGEGRRDESGDFTPGAGLSETQRARILAFLEAGSGDPATTLQNLRAAAGNSPTGQQGADSLEEILTLLDAFPCGAAAARIDPSIVRGLAYYTGPVFEAALTFEIRDAKNRVRQFGSVAGGGRYDRLVRRFGGEDLPATGMSIGVDRLAAALDAAQPAPARTLQGPVLVLSMGDMTAHQRMAAELRAAGVPAEVYSGEGGMRRQMRYADRRGSPIVVIEGENEREAGTVVIKDLLLGARLAEGIETHEKWKEHPAQIAAPRDRLLANIREIRTRQSGGTGDGPQ